MEKYFTKTFYKFFFGFLVIIALAFGVMAITASVSPSPVDTVAHPE